MIDEKYQGKKYRTRGRPDGSGRLPAEIAASGLRGLGSVFGVVHGTGYDEAVWLNDDLTCLSGQPYLDLIEVTPWDGLKPGMLCMVSNNEQFWGIALLIEVNDDGQALTRRMIDGSGPGNVYQFVRPLTEQEWKIVRGE